MDRLIDKILKKAVDRRASDIFLVADNYASARIDGSIVFDEECMLTNEDTRQIYEEITGLNHQETFMNKTEMDMAYSNSLGRFRINMFVQQGKLGFVLRYIPNNVPSMEKLFLPVEVMKKLASIKRGLVLVTGITGSGKSTTLASMLHYVNHNMKRHIVTIEDPVEFLYKSEKSLINQREVGRDTPDFPTALRAVVRQSPDVILIGEMRDRETVESALQAAETGHLVLSTLHTLNAIQTVERILAFFPPHQHSLIRLQMALVLEGVISQRLIKRSDQPGRVPSVEIMLGTPTVKELLEQGKTRSLSKAVSEGTHYGCQSFNQSLYNLVMQKFITKEDALKYSDDPDKLKMMFRGISQSMNIAPPPKKQDELSMTQRRKAVRDDKIITSPSLTDIVKPSVTDRVTDRVKRKTSIPVSTSFNTKRRTSIPQSSFGQSSSKLEDSGFNKKKSSRSSLGLRAFTFGKPGTGRIKADEDKIED